MGEGGAESGGDLALADWEREARAGRDSAKAAAVSVFPGGVRRYYRRLAEWLGRAAVSVLPSAREGAGHLE